MKLILSRHRYRDAKVAKTGPTRALNAPAGLSLIKGVAILSTAPRRNCL